MSYLEGMIIGLCIVTDFYERIYSAHAVGDLSLLRSSL